MPAFGGYSPFPLRFGGGGSRLEVIHQSLLSQRGTAYDTSSTSAVFVEAMAHARALSAAWGENFRLSHIWDPNRVTAEILERWESILRLVPSADDAEATRRAAVASRLARIGEAATDAELHTRLKAEVGDVFVQFERVPYASAVITVPNTDYPWGSVSAGAPWSSTTRHVIALLQKPSTYTEGDFYKAAAKVSEVLDAALPSWCTFAWYREPDSGGIAVSGGPSLAGFFLDEINLDNSIFDV